MHVRALHVPPECMCVYACLCVCMTMHVFVCMRPPCASFTFNWFSKCAFEHLYVKCMCMHVYVMYAGLIVPI